MYQLSTFFHVGAVVSSESLFRDQTGGRKKRQIDNPIFFEDLNPTAEQIEFCNNDSQCLLDLIVTNNSAVAMTTMEFNMEIITTLNALSTSYHFAIFFKEIHFIHSSYRQLPTYHQWQHNF